MLIKLNIVFIKLNKYLNMLLESVWSKIFCGKFFRLMLQIVYF